MTNPLDMSVGMLSTRVGGISPGHGSGTFRNAERWDSMKSLVLSLAALSLAACMVRVPVSEQPAPPAVYSQSVPYTAPLPSTGYAAPVAIDPYCAETAAEAEDAAAIAAATGRGRDVGRAARTERDARRNCR